MDNNILVTCILSSTLVATLITAIKELVLWVLNRKAKVKDDERVDLKEEHRKELSSLKDSIVHYNDQYNDLLTKLSDHICSLEKSVEATTLSNRILLKERIECIALSYIEKGKISYGARKNLHDLWDMYHFTLGGNGDLDDIMNRVDNLPLDI